EEQHRRREQAGVIHAHGIHPPLGGDDVAVALARRLLQLAQMGAGDAAVEVLVADLAVEHGGAAGARHAVHGGAAGHPAVDVFEDVAVGLVLVMVRIHVDDEEVLVVALARLLGGVLEMLLDRELVEAQVADLATRHVHGRSPGAAQATTKMSSPRRTTSYLRSFSLRLPMHSPVRMSYS